MKALRQALMSWIALGLGAFAALAFGGDQVPAPSTEQLQRTLESMRENSTEGHPDLHGQLEGFLHYEKGDYAGAMTYFLLGARYADKVSQLCIGLLYLNGQGVPKDAATAYAWLALSAERNYPQFVSTRDSVWAQLTSQQRKKAMETLKQLVAEYGDAVAKPRMVAQLQRAKLAMTGSPAGFDGYITVGTHAQFAAQLGGWSGTAGLGPVEAFPRCDLRAIEGGVITGCGDYWADYRWNASKYFKAIDSFWLGTVKVGPLQEVKNPQPSLPSSTPAAPSQDGAHP